MIWPLTRRFALNRRRWQIDRRGFDTRCGFRGPDALIHIQAFQLQFQLIDLQYQLLGLLPKQQATEFVEQSLQPINLGQIIAFSESDLHQLRRLKTHQGL